MGLVLEKTPVTIAHLAQRLILFAVSFHCVIAVKNDFPSEAENIPEETFLFVGECF